MFKSFILFAVLAVAAARPGLIGSPLVYSDHSYAGVGTVIKSIPTAVSHQSQSIVHSHAHVLEDVVAPVVKTHYAASPYVHGSYAAASPYVHGSYAAGVPVLKSYAATPYAQFAPISYGAQYDTLAAHYAAPAVHYAAPATSHYSAW